MSIKNTKHQKIILNFQATLEIKALLQAEADRLKVTKSEVLRSFILSLKVGASEKVVIDVDTEIKRFTLRLPKFLVDAAKLKAKSKGMTTTRWIESLVKMSVLKKTTLTETELFFIRENKRQLLAIGNNLNQIAKHFNTQALGNNKTSTDILKLELLQELIELVNKNVETINSHIKASERTW
jgi:hypothetical protein